ncbi:hypothetical protein GCM10011487_63460 [Steroidobacter agaridevorans]|uniref:Uncharacterized protein n=1 Tax=Steroidobacter agaridevorans TaxID=2695856 RepID=A0A829YPC9_9GAMM|nr:hypothetical protein GCM10011487_63460 [Steroidobacter agaridevorans]
MRYGFVRSHSLPLSGVGWNEGNATVADLDVYSLVDAEAGFLEPIASEADERNGWWWPVT